MTTIQTDLTLPPQGLLGILMARVGRSLAGRRGRWATLEDLSQLSEHALGDIGLSRGDLPGAAARAMRDHATRLSLTL